MASGQSTAPVTDWQTITGNDPGDWQTIPAGIPTSVHQAMVGAQPTGTISAAPTGVGPWLQKLEGDVRYGTGETAPGRLLQALGARGLNRGVSEGAVAQGPGSLITGPIHVAQGIAQIPSSPLQGILKIGSGALEAATIPLSFAGAAPGNAEAVAERTLPSVAKYAAGQKFQQVAAVANKLPVNLGPASDVALQIKDYADAGATLPKVISRFVQRATAPGSEPVTYEEARLFYQNASKLSADETNRLTPKMKMLVGQFVNRLGQSIGATAEQVGQGQNYVQAMQGYRYGAQADKAVKTALKYGIGAGGGMVGADFLGRLLANRIGR